MDERRQNNEKETEKLENLIEKNMASEVSTERNGNMEKNRKIQDQSNESKFFCSFYDEKNRNMK